MSEPKVSIKLKDNTTNLTNYPHVIPSLSVIISLSKNIIPKDRIIKSNNFTSHMTMNMKFQTIEKII